MVGFLWDVRRDRADARAVPESTTGEDQFYWGGSILLGRINSEEKQFGSSNEEKFEPTLARIAKAVKNDSKKAKARSK
jgi:hypothetical protein